MNATSNESNSGPDSQESSPRGAVGRSRDPPGTCRTGPDPDERNSIRNVVLLVAGPDLAGPLSSGSRGLLQERAGLGLQNGDKVARGH